jgi:hypothetical protein
MFAYTLQHIKEVASMLSSRWTQERPALVPPTSEEGSSFEVAQLQSFKIELRGPGSIDDHSFARMQRWRQQGRELRGQQRIRLGSKPGLRLCGYISI